MAQWFEHCDINLQIVGLNLAHICYKDYVSQSSHPGIPTATSREAKQLDSCRLCTYRISLEVNHLKYTRGRSMTYLVVQLVTDLQYMNSNPGLAMSERCFFYQFASLSREVARPIYNTMCTKVAVKQQPLYFYLIYIRFILMYI